MTQVRIAQSAHQQLARLIDFLELPSDTPRRVASTVELLGEFPEMGVLLEGEWSGYRSVLATWAWMRVIYRFESELDEVWVVAIIDTRSKTIA